MINFIKSTDPGEGAEALALKVYSALDSGKKTLWLIPGGSNVPIAVDVMKRIRQKINMANGSFKGKLENLTITLTDERYGPVGHKDSNWQQLLDAGFDFSGTNIVPVLRNAPLNETVFLWSKDLERVFSENSSIIGQFGIGPDGHTAGIFAGSLAVANHGIVCAYEATQYTRMTLTPKAIRKIQSAFAFAFGQSKQAQLIRLRDEEIFVSQQPAQLLKSLNEAYIYSDSVGPKI